MLNYGGVRSCEKLILQSLILALLIFINADAAYDVSKVYVFVRRLSSPSYLALGGSARLRCEFATQLRYIYSIKWYKDDFEFYCVKPTIQKQADSQNNPVARYRQKSYEQSGFEVNMERSDEHFVAISNISPDAAGVYKCELTETAPRFASSSKSVRLQVVDLPNSVPTISKYHRAYLVGELVSPMCVSRRSYPSVQLQWFIDDVPTELVNGAEEQSYSETALVSTTDTYSRLSWTVGLEYLTGIPVVIRCTARMNGTDYMESSEISVTIARPAQEHLVQPSRTSALAPSTGCILVFVVLCGFICSLVLT